MMAGRAVALREDQIRRYGRHVLLPDVGGRGQERLLAARVVVELGPERAAEVAALARKRSCPRPPTSGRRMWRA